MAGRLAVIALVVAVAGLLIFVGILPSFSGPRTTLTGTKSITGSGTKSATQPESSSRTHSVPPAEIVSGGPPPDGIPSIDNPKFIPAREVNQFIPAGQTNQFLPVSQTNPISDSSTVLGIYYNGEAKAYPLYIMVWHEIVNDVVGGKPVAITYCPLCYSSAAFVRELNGTTVTFGTSGKLYNNNLVMYDRLTSSLWSEIWGEAISGKLTGSVLQRVPIDVTTWGEWKALYPNTLLLTTETGFSRPYGSDPYGDYYTSPDIAFPLNHQDGRLPVKQIVLGVSINGRDRAYPLNSLNGEIIKDSVGTQGIVLFVTANQTARIFSSFVDGRELHFQYSNGNFVDGETHSTWDFNGIAVSGPMLGKTLVRFPTETAFWFAWAAFYPDTQIYSG